jgi:putative tryptophan/tyrosine transport system substrate-binding protein
MKRRNFIALLGSAAVTWPLAARAQQPAIPVIGWLSLLSPGSDPAQRAFRQGLNDVGYVEGENVIIEYRFSDGQADRLPALAAELVRRRVAVIVAPSGPSVASAAKAATTTIPIVFLIGLDPVALGLVSSLARPGGNLTGINFFTTELAAKRLELLRELVPQARRIAVLVNPSAANTEVTMRDIEPAARAMGLQVHMLTADSSREIDAAFASFVPQPADALFVATSPFFLSRRLQIAHLATRHAVPAVYSLRDYADAGGLMSYGASLTDAMRQIGVYCGRILKGAKPADLPVAQSTKFELVINAQAARTIGVEVPPLLLARADEVIE